MHARSVAGGETDLQKIIDRLEMMSTLSAADIQGVLYGLIDMLTRELAEGQIVRVGDLGTFRITIRSDSQLSESAIQSDSLDPHISFLPGRRLKQMLSPCEFRKL